MHGIRCKFRVLAHVTKDATTLDLAPINARGKYNPEGSEENAAFWSATPSGRASIRLPGTTAEIAETYPVGKAVFIDLAPADDGDWTLEGCRLQFDGSVHAKFSRYNGPIAGEIEMGVNAVPAAKFLAEQAAKSHSATLAYRAEHVGPDDASWPPGFDSGAPRARWLVSLTPTDG